MSGKIAGQVWDLDLPHAQAFVLLAMADHADHEGNHVRPTVGLVAWKTGYSERQVQYAIRALVDRGILVAVVPAGRRTPTEYRIELEGAPRKAPRVVSRGANTAPVRGASVAPHNADSGVQNPALWGAIAVAPEPSVNRQSLSANAERRAPAHARTRELSPLQLTVNAYYQALGRDPFAVGKPYAQHVAAGAELVKSGVPLADVQACTAWLASDSWRQAKGKPPTLADVAAALPMWREQGRPARAKDPGARRGLDAMIEGIAEDYADGYQHDTPDERIARMLDAAYARNRGARSPAPGESVRADDGRVDVQGVDARMVRRISGAAARIGNP